jgi:hypothetical protein
MTRPGQGVRTNQGNVKSHDLEHIGVAAVGTLLCFRILPVAFLILLLWCMPS